MSGIKPIKVWGKGGPNPPKVHMLIAELGLPSDVVDIQFSELKNPEYLAVNPNGRMPSIYDPNTDITVWESGAIYEYLIERYDTEHKLSFAPGTAESYHAKQWLFFQASGQGPYYGQAAWFLKFHPEKVPSAVDRYVKEIARVTGVLDGHLAKQKVEGGDGPWLVGNKFSYADLSFVSWQNIATMVISAVGTEHYNPADFPHVKDWLDRMGTRASVKTVMDSTKEG